MKEHTTTQQQLVSNLSNAGTLKKLIWQVQDIDSENEGLYDSQGTSINVNTAQPWCADFLQYIDTVQAPLPPGMSTIQWWGVRVYLSKVLLWLLILLLWQLNSSCYHAAWSALAQDYLLIMSSSVSSKRCGCAESTSHLGLSRHLPYVDTSHMLYPLSVDHHLLWGFPPCLGLGPSMCILTRWNHNSKMV